MIIRIIKFLKMLLKAKYSFKEPKNCNLIFFDDINKKEVKELLKKYTYFILQTRVDRINKIYLSFKILFLSIKNFRGNPLNTYLLALIEIIKPKVVFTFTDNSHKFSDFARLKEKKHKFLALQNGARYEHKIIKHLVERKKINPNYGKFYIPHFLCFGQYEINDYKSNNIEVKNFTKVGSLKLTNFINKIKKNKTKIKENLYDVCLISDAFCWDKILDKTSFPVEEGVAKLLKFTVRFSMKNKIKFIMSTRNRRNSFQEEMEFYKNNLTKSEFKYLSKRFFFRKDSFHTYKLMKQSKVVIGTMSTTLRENLFIKGKILHCNFTKTNIFDFPIKGICSLKVCDFHIFEKRLLQILSISKKSFFSKMKKKPSFVVEDNKINSTIKSVRNKLDIFLK